MKKIFLTFLYFFLIFPTVSFAGALDDLLKIPKDVLQDTDKLLEEKIFNLGEIRVSSHRLSSSKDEYATDTPGNVTIVGERQIEEDGETSAPQVLGRLEGVTYSDTLGTGSGAMVDLRGFGGEAKQALVLFDGVRAVEPFDNSMSWQLYPTEYLQSIEVRRGGQSTTYGEGALSGAIAMETKGPTKDFHASAETSYGSFVTEKEFVETSGTVAGTGFYIGSRYFTSDGYRQNADEEGASVLAKVERKLSEFIGVKNNFYYANDKSGIPGPLTYAQMQENRRQKDPVGQFGDKFIDSLTQDALTLTYYADPVDMEFSNLFSWRSRHQNSTESFASGTSILEIATTTYSDTFQGVWAWENNWINSDASAGVEWSADDIDDPSVFLDTSGGISPAENMVDKTMVGGFWEERLTFWKKLIAEIGLRTDYIHWNLHDYYNPATQERKKAEHLSPKIGIEYKIFDPLSLYASYSESFKAPDTNTLILTIPTISTANPNIDPSVAHHYETGVRYAHPVWGTLRVDIFYIDTKKEVIFDNITFTSENFDTRRRGCELADEIAITKQLQVFANYTYTNAEFDGGLYAGNKIPLIPESRWTGGFVLDVTKNLSISMSATGVYNQFALNDFNNIFPIDDYWTLGGRVSYHQHNWEMYFRAENLLDERYSSFVTSNGVSKIDYNPSPALYVEGGVRIRI